MCTALHTSSLLVNEKSQQPSILVLIYRIHNVHNLTYKFLIVYQCDRTMSHFSFGFDFFESHGYNVVVTAIKKKEPKKTNEKHERGLKRISSELPR